MRPSPRVGSASEPTTVASPVTDSFLGALAAMTAAFEDALEFASRSRVLLLRHVLSQIDIDIILGGLPFERSAVAVAQRPQDLLDLEGLITAHPEADLAMVRRWIAEFSTAATMPSLLEEFDRLAGRLGR